jgi:hypothetical protein
LREVIKMPVLFKGEMYNDDRLFVLSVCKCTVKEQDAGVIETVIYHENPPADHIWSLVTFRNTARYPVTRVDHFATQEEAREYMRSIEPGVPRASLGGTSPESPLTYDQFVAWKSANGLQEYDYRQMFSPGGENAREMILSPRPSRPR